MDTKMDTYGRRLSRWQTISIELSKLEELQPQTNTSAMSVETAEGDGDSIPQDFDEQEQEGDAEDSIGGGMESEERV